MNRDLFKTPEPPPGGDRSPGFGVLDAQARRTRFLYGAFGFAMLAAAFGATLSWTASKLASLAMVDATQQASASLDVIASAVTAEAQEAPLEPILRTEIHDAEPPIDLRGSLGGVEIAATPTPAPALYSVESETRLAELDRKAEAASRISDYGGGPASRRSPAR